MNEKVSDMKDEIQWLGQVKQSSTIYQQKRKEKEKDQEKGDSGMGMWSISVRENWTAAAAVVCRNGCRTGDSIIHDHLVAGDYSGCHQARSLLRNPGYKTAPGSKQGLCHL